MPPRDTTPPPPANASPSAHAGPDQTVSEGAVVTLDGSKSSGPDGSAISYRWTSPSNITLQGASTAFPTFTAPEVTGDTAYTFELEVSDGRFTDTDTVTITVRDEPPPANSPPVANAGDDQTVPAGADVRLDGSASYDPDGDAITYNWTAPDGITLLNGDTATPSFTAPSVLSDTPYTFELGVSDGNKSATDTVVVTVRNASSLPPTQLPVAEAGDNQDVPENTIVHLNGSATSDPDGSATSFSWTAPAGIVLSDTAAAAPYFTAPEVTGDTMYNFTLTVTDHRGYTATDTVTITVRDADLPDMPAPTAPLICR